MAVYMILEIEVVDAETYGQYVQQTPATVAQYSGRYLVRGGAITRLSGGWNPQRMVVIESPHNGAIPGVAELARIQRDRSVARTIHQE